MNLLKKTAVFCFYFSAGLLLLHLTATGAFATDNNGNWRPTFDLIMRWANFIILAGLLYKFSRLPLKNFLDGKKKEVAEKIEKLEAEKEKMLGELDRQQQSLEDSKVRLSRLKERIIAQGEKNKLDIIEDAKRESNIMLAAAKLKIESRTLEARQLLKSEMIDAAVTLAMEKLPKKITDADNQKFIDAFLAKAASE